MPDKTDLALRGQHLIAGTRTGGTETFVPAHGPARDFAVGTPALVGQACAAAEEAFWSYGYATRAERAAFLDTIADEIEARPDAIPFFGELGSVNPMFLLPGAVRARGAEIAGGWAGSLTMGAGQFCTNPGIAILIDGPDADAFTDAATEALKPVGAQVMPTGGIAVAYRAGRDRVAGTRGVREVLASMCDRRDATPYLFATTGREWLANHALGAEVFGPPGLIVRVADAAEMEAVARSLRGQLTCTLHLDAGDTALGQRLMPILERKAGRVPAHGFPTGVEVRDAMAHGRPYPASTNFGATSVGTLPIRRFLRPVSYQNLPGALLPEDLRG